MRARDVCVIASPTNNAPRDDAGEDERWGCGEMVLSRVVLVHSRDELVAFGPGTPVSIEMDVTLRVPQDDFVFSAGIYHAGGTSVYGTNTEIAGLMLELLETNIRFVMAALDLVPGTYRIETATHTRNSRAFDYRRGVIHFVAGSRVHDIGVYRLKHRTRTVQRADGSGGGDALRPAEEKAIDHRLLNAEESIGRGLLLRLCRASALSGDVF